MPFESPLPVAFRRWRDAFPARPRDQSRFLPVCTAALLLLPFPFLASLDETVVHERLPPIYTLLSTNMALVHARKLFLASYSGRRLSYGAVLPLAFAPGAPPKPSKGLITV